MGIGLGNGFGKCSKKYSGIGLENGLGEWLGGMVQGKVCGKVGECFRERFQNGLGKDLENGSRNG